jgi:hypothetical protein
MLIKIIKIFFVLLGPILSLVTLCALILKNFNFPITDDEAFLIVIKIIASGSPIILLVIWFIYFNVSHQLLNKYFEYHDEEFPFLSAFFKVLQIWWWGNFVISKEKLFDTVRITIELDIFHDVFDRHVTKDIKKENIKKIKAKLSNFLVNPNNDVHYCEIDNCFTFSENEDSIEHYFKSLIKFNNNFDKDKLERFLLGAEIKEGFVAPLHLIDGLLDQFESTWEKVIKDFHREIKGEYHNNLFFQGTKFQRIQLFTLDCWLQWGPSIPICNCEQWSGSDFIALQYGYGDENNSRSLMPLIGKDHDDFNSLKTAMQSSPLAWNTQLKVRPVWIWEKCSGQENLNSDILINRLEMLGKAQSSIKNPRSASRIDRKIIDHKDKIISGHMVLDFVSAPLLVNNNEKKSEKILTKLKSQREYYSAYVWVIFVVCWKSTSDNIEDTNIKKFLNSCAGRPVFPVEPKKKISQIETNFQMWTPWLGIFPFFVHGNIADDTTYAAFKEQLVAKTLSCIRLALDIRSGLEDKEKENMDIPIDNEVQLKAKLSRMIEFRYTCAVDDSGYHEDKNIKSPDWDSSLKSSKQIKDYLVEALAWEENSELRESVIMQPPAAGLDTERYSACHLPDIVSNFYKYCADQESSATDNT